LSVTLAELIRN